MFVTLCSTVLLYGCGGGGGSDSTDLRSEAEVNPIADRVEFTTSVDPDVPISHGSQLALEVKVSYEVDNEDYRRPVRRAVPDGTLVRFTVDEGGGNVTASALTKNGVAKATYHGGTYGGLVSIQAATDSGISDTLAFHVAASDVGSISVQEVIPENRVLNVQNTGNINVANITFNVTDEYGNAVKDGKTVYFEIPTPLRGGERLSSTEATTLNGTVSVSIHSGTIPGPISVRAIYSSGDGPNVSADAQLSFVSGTPDADHIRLVSNHLNIAGGVKAGLQNTVTAYIGDRYGNVPNEETHVSFITECGTIGESTGFTTTTTLGVATALLQVSTPTVPELDGGDPTANPGLCRVLVYTSGSESFKDINGNGVFDKGIDILKTDLSDPYLDVNDNGQYDIGEMYFDADGNGEFTPSDGEFQGDTYIWDSINILISDYAKSLELTPKTFEIRLGECQTFSVNMMDIYGNALVSGTTISVESTAGEIQGLPTYTQPDTSGSGFIFSFDLCSEPFPAEDEEDPAVETAQITARLAPAGEATTAPGNNGEELVEIANGTINNPIPLEERTDVFVPRVVFTLPNDSATDVPVNQNILISFSEEMDKETFTGSNIYISKVDPVNGNIWRPTEVTFSDSGTEVELTLRVTQEAGDEAETNAISTFQPETEYVVTLTDNLKNLDGMPMAEDYTFSFTTAAEELPLAERPDASVPVAIFTQPEADATNVPVNQKVTISFSEEMNEATFSSSTAYLSVVTPVGDTLWQPTNVVLDEAGTSVELTLADTALGAADGAEIPFELGTRYIVTLSSTLKSSVGVPMGKAYQFSFTTLETP